jgi:hypothetical protein
MSNARNLANLLGTGTTVPKSKLGALDIVNADVNASASIAQSKMEALTTANLPSGTPKYMVMAELGANTSVTTTSTSYVDVGISITMPSAVISSLSKIWIRFDGTTSVWKDTHAFADFLVTRTLPSSQTWDPFTVGVVAGGTEIYDNSGGEVLDDSLGSGDHTYKLQVRDAHGTSIYAGNIYYRYRGWRATLIGF